MRQCAQNSVARVYGKRYWILFGFTETFMLVVISPAKKINMQASSPPLPLVPCIIILITRKDLLRVDPQQVKMMMMMRMKQLKMRNTLLDLQLHQPVQTYLVVLPSFHRTQIHQSKHHQSLNHLLPHLSSHLPQHSTNHLRAKITSTRYNLLE